MPDGKNTRRVPSPYEKWPGYIVVPEELSPAQFLEWWEKQQAIPDDDPRPHEFQAWSSRYHLVQEWHIEGLNPEEHLDESGMLLPSMNIALLVIAATQPLIINARLLPNLREPSSDGDSGN